MFNRINQNRLEEIAGHINAGEFAPLTVADRSTIARLLLEQARRSKRPKMSRAERKAMFARRNDLIWEHCRANESEPEHFWKKSRDLWIRLDLYVTKRWVDDCGAKDNPYALGHSYCPLWAIMKNCPSRRPPKSPETILGILKKVTNARNP